MTSRRVTGTAFVTVNASQIRGIHAALQKWMEPELTKELDVADKKAANTMAKDLRAELRPVSRHMAKAVRVKRAKTGKPGWVVGSRRKVAFFWPFVIGGTQDHGPRRAAALTFIPGWNPYVGTSSHGVGSKVVRTRHVRGVRAQPLVEQVARRNEGRVVREIDDDMTRMTGS